MWRVKEEQDQNLDLLLSSQCGPGASCGQEVWGRGRRLCMWVGEGMRKSRDLMEGGAARSSGPSQGPMKGTTGGQGSELSRLAWALLWPCWTRRCCWWPAPWAAVPRECWAKGCLLDWLLAPSCQTVGVLGLYLGRGDVTMTSPWNGKPGCDSGPWGFPTQDPPARLWGGEWGGGGTSRRGSWGLTLCCWW